MDARPGKLMLKGNLKFTTNWLLQGINEATISISPEKNGVRVEFSASFKKTQLLFAVFWLVFGVFLFGRGTDPRYVQVLIVVCAVMLSSVMAYLGGSLGLEHFIRRVVLDHS